MPRTKARKRSATKEPASYADASPSPSLVQEPLSHLLPQPEVDARGRLRCPLMNNGAGGWREDKSEERVRQGYILHLQQHYGYAFDQMLDEQRVQHGRRSPKADIVIWESTGARNSSPRPSPKIVVECKAENIDIHPRDFYQGESYARATAAELLVMHNERQTHVFKVVPGLPGELVQINEIPKAADWGDARKIEQIKNSLRVFNRREFQDLLFKCHSILRDVHKMEPGVAFDAISKVLFIKMYVERTGTWGTFSTEFLNLRNASRLPTDKPVHEGLFEQTKQFYKKDEIFSDRDQLEISEETFRRLVKELERFNLSATSDDIKGLAFERFLGATFRGNLGQFFTPRPVVNFIVDLLDPAEGQLICDPAAGSGGFLIRAFEHVRTKIEVEIQAKKDAARAEIEALNLPPEKEESKIEAAFASLNKALNPETAGSRIFTLARSRIYGMDAEPRSARTAKMNMIMHGDGHGGIHFHDGLLDMNGIFDGRFDIVLTNPPFGANVGDDQKVGASEQTRVITSEDYVKDCTSRYADELAAWEASHERLVAASKAKAPILNLFEIGKEKANRPTEILFLERCINLLKAGGRLGIVLPDGNLNNPSLGWLRRWAEGKGRLVAVVSLPEEVFRSSETSAKTSVVILQKFTDAETTKWESLWNEAKMIHDPVFAKRRDETVVASSDRISSGDDRELAKLLAEMKALGASRAIPPPRLKDPPPYPRGVVQSEVGKPRWTSVSVADTGRKPSRDEAAKTRKKLRDLRQRFDRSWSKQHEERSEELRRELRVALRKVDRDHSRALWERVRSGFDYPVFTAAPEFVGITATGDTGPDVPNQLPTVLAAWSEFSAWVSAGADDAKKPQFAEEK